ncbi:hypothetical protein M8542_22715 [Amycolatopsis sp. OK19-0408]|uniref:Uncharacterized protein n=1 Tax=Amycolatopsis iheyensis TaxID=2945988 RepID=A0A9X2NEY3_9PSEU|nr:hypothetical protein [Amycolatopsis iheyensis]MCR6485642.1 hypothetical protein [Amycolatopsis iheyensis]
MSTGYAARTGVDRGTFVGNMPSVLTPEQVTKAVLEVVDGDAAEYQVSGTGLRTL